MAFIKAEDSLHNLEGPFLINTLQPNKASESKSSGDLEAKPQVSDQCLFEAPSGHSHWYHPNLDTELLQQPDILSSLDDMVPLSYSRDSSVASEAPKTQPIDAAELDPTIKKSHEDNTPLMFFGSIDDGPWQAPKGEFFPVDHASQNRLVEVKSEDYIYDTEHTGGGNSSRQFPLESFPNEIKVKREDDDGLTNLFRLNDDKLTWTNSNQAAVAPPQQQPQQQQLLYQQDTNVSITHPFSSLRTTQVPYNDQGMDRIQRLLTSDFSLYGEASEDTRLNINHGIDLNDSSARIKLPAGSSKPSSYTPLPSPPALERHPVSMPELTFQDLLNGLSAKDTGRPGNGESTSRRRHSMSETLSETNGDKVGKRYQSVEPNKCSRESNDHGPRDRASTRGSSCDSEQQPREKRNSKGELVPDKALLKRRRNTEAARRSRARKAERMNELEEKCEVLSNRNSRLEEEVLWLRSLLSQQAHKPCE